MSHLSKKDLEFSPEKQAVFERLLKQKGLNLSSARKIPLRKNPSHAPLSFAQQRLWFIHQLESASPAYNIHSQIRLKGRINVQGLLQSFIEIVRRHETLRSNFISIDGKPLQIIEPDRRLKMPVVDLTTSANATWDLQLLKLASREAQRPFNLSDGPLMRIWLLRLGSDDHVLLLTMHHI